VTFFNIGWRNDFVIRWWSAFAIGWPIATSTAYLAMPFARSLTQRIGNPGCQGQVATRPGGSHRLPLTSGLRPFPAVRMPTGEGVKSP
jgi:hypothetical protein